MFNKFRFCFRLKKRKKDNVADSVQNISKAITKLVDIRVEAQATVSSQSRPTYKYDFIWKLLENVYERLDQVDIDRLNQTNIQMAYDALKNYNDK